MLRSLKICSLLILSIVESAAGALEFTSKGNPLITQTAAGDPDAHVWGDTLWVYCSKDGNLRDYGLGSNDWSYAYMDGYHAFSTTDMVNWIDHGEVFHSRNVGWGPSGWMWAPSAAWNGKTGSDAKYYLYYPHKDWEGTWRVGVATSWSPSGPFSDSGKPMDKVVGIDPKFFRDTDNMAYLYYNSGKIVKLAESWMEVAEEPRDINYNKDNDGRAWEGRYKFEEGSHMFKRGNVYYYSYSNWSDDAPTSTAYYATGTSPYGPFKWRGALAGKKSGSQDHHSIVQFKGHWYYFYHQDTPWEEKKQLGWYGQRRITCYIKMYFNRDRTIRFVTPGTFYGNAGGQQYTTQNGVLYQWDMWYSGSNSEIGTTGATIAGTVDGALYQTYRFGRFFTYAIPLQNGNYTVTFRFAETHHESSGRRSFNIDMEGSNSVRDLDVFSIAGKDKAYDINRHVEVRDNELNIQFTANIDTAMIAAIKVVPRRSWPKLKLRW